LEPGTAAVIEAYLAEAYLAEAYLAEALRTYVI
jgi:hypothetical protein